MMNIESIQDPILQEDLEILANNDFPFQKLKNVTVFITGVTGLVGSQLFRALACFNRIHNLNMNIYALVRNINKAQAIFGEMLNRSDLHLVIGDVTEDYNLYFPKGVKIDYIIHGATVTTSKTMVEYPVDTILTAFNGTNQMLKLATEHKIRSFIYLSSMEMYGTFPTTLAETPLVTENMQGTLDVLAVRSNYPESKRLCENMCIAYLKQYDVPVKIARLSQTFGAGILSGENRVFAQFARSVIQKEDIILHTLGESEGNYCYTRDTVYALLILMIKGINGEAYNIVNEENHTTIVDMAKLVATRLAKGSIRVVFDISKTDLFGYAVDTKMKLSSEKMKSLGWIPTVSLEESYRRMIESMKITGV